MSEKGEPDGYNMHFYMKNMDFWVVQPPLFTSLSLSSYGFTKHVTVFP